MAALSLLDVQAYVHSHDFTCDSNQAQVDMTVAALDGSTFCSNGWTDLVPGVKSVSLSLAGFWQASADSVDASGYADLGVINRTITLAPNKVDGSVAYLFRAGHFSYSLLGTHGELAPFNLSANGTSGVGVVRGRLAVAKAEVTTTGAIGTDVTLPALGATDTAYASLHLLGTAGTTITVVLESDADDTFASATTRATFGPLTATGGNWASVAGAVTDTSWRFRVTAITGTWQVAAAVGVA